MKGDRVSINGVVGQGRTDARLRGSITQLGFNGYTYDSIRLNGRLRDKAFNGRITAHDKNLNME